MTEHDPRLQVLIDLAYEAAVEPLRWQVFVDAFDRYLDGAYVQLHAHDFAANLNTGGVVAHHATEFLDSYKGYYHRLNPIVPKLASAPIGQVYRTEDLVDLDELRRSEYYNDWFLPQEDSAIGCGAVVCRDQQRLFVFGAHLPARYVERKIVKTRRTISKLVPHLQRSIKIHRTVARISGMADEFRQTASQASDAIFHLDVMGRVQWMNLSAEKICSSEVKFRVDQRGKIVTGDEDLDQQICFHCSSPKIGVMRFVVDQRGEAGPLLVGCLIASPKLPSLWDRLGSPVGAILSLQSVAGQGAWETVVSHFQFTHAEATLARELVRGLTLDECAAAHKTSIHTVRNQLRALLDKTDTHRQSELVALLAPTVGSLEG